MTVVIEKLLGLSGEGGWLRNVMFMLKLSVKTRTVTKTDPITYLPVQSHF